MTQMTSPRTSLICHVGSGFDIRTAKGIEKTATGDGLSDKIDKEIELGPFAPLLTKQPVPLILDNAADSVGRKIRGKPNRVHRCHGGHDQTMIHIARGRQTEGNGHQAEAHTKPHVRQRGVSDAPLDIPTTTPP